VRAFTKAIERALSNRRAAALLDLRASQASKKDFEKYLAKLQE
jgi:hypothetical protein